MALSPTEAKEQLSYLNEVVTRIERSVDRQIPIALARTSGTSIFIPVVDEDLIPEVIEEIIKRYKDAGWKGVRFQQSSPASKHVSLVLTYENN